jgi:serine phosphatase RsbU (regulator of sigma subunit)
MGRHPSCQIVLDNAAVSRNHAQIVQSRGTWYLEDLRSRNGTLVNGTKISGRTELRDGDEIRVCEVVLRFHRGTLRDSEEMLHSDTLALSRVWDEGAADGTIHVSSLSGSASNDSLLIDESGPDSSSIITSLDVTNRAPRTAVRPEAKLRAVMEITQNLALALKTDEVLPKILESLFKIFPQAERGFVVLKDPASDALEVRSARSRGDQSGNAPRLNVMMLREAINRARATLSADSALDARSGFSNDAGDRRCRSVICAPLTAQSGESLGAIQIDTFDAATPFTDDDLEVLTTVSAQAGLALMNAELRTADLGQHNRDDLDFATQLQLGFVPNVPPTAAGYEFFDFYETAQRVGGDFLDYVPLPEGRIAMNVGDVAGKGVPAALLMARCCADARSQLLAKSSPAGAMFQLNENIFASGAGHRFVTMVLAVLDPRQHTVTLVNAGHLPPLLRRADGTVGPVGVDACELPLGIASTVQFRETTLRIAPGELLLLYSDGVTEAMNASAELYGVPRVAQVLSKHRGTARSLIEELVSSIDGFCGAVSPRDDMCLVAVQRVAGE